MTTDPFITGLQERPATAKNKVTGFRSAAETLTPEEAKAARRGAKPPDATATHKSYTIRDVPVEWLERIDRIADELGLSKKDTGHALLLMAFRAWDAGERPALRERPRAKNILAET